MNLKTISDELLLLKMKELVREERELLNVLLRHLQEVESRRLFAKLGYSSLFDYATKALSYAEDQACRRIAAMRLLKILPELESKVESGALTLTTLNLAHTLFRAEQKAGYKREKGLKLELLEKLENKTTKEAEKILYAASPLEKPIVPREKIREISNQESEVRFVCSQEFVEKVEHLKGLLAHSHPGATLAQILEYACDQALAKVDPLKKSAAVPSAVARANRHIPEKTRRFLWQKYQGKCARCASRYALQIEHLTPFALGGKNEPQNLTLLCRHCNQRAAIEVFGREKMYQYLEKT